MNKITKRTNIFYKTKVDQNKKLNPRAMLEKRAWEMISNMDKYDRELLINGFDKDKTKWEIFLKTIKDNNFVFYKPYKNR